MRLLFDPNLSRHLVGHLRDAFPDSRHVTEVELDAASDREVWEFARGNDLVLVSKDSDFRQLAFLYGPPPKVIWLRVGNVSTGDIVQVLAGQPRRWSSASSAATATPARSNTWPCAAAAS